MAKQEFKIQNGRPSGKHEKSQPRDASIDSRLSLLNGTTLFGGRAGRVNNSVPIETLKARLQEAIDHDARFQAGCKTDTPNTSPMNKPWVQEVIAPTEGLDQWTVVAQMVCGELVKMPFTIQGESVFLVDGPLQPTERKVTYPPESVLNAGTSEGVRKAWETRKLGIKTANEGYGYHGEAYLHSQRENPSADHMKAADDYFDTVASELISAGHFKTNDEARDFLDSTIGRHLADNIGIGKSVSKVSWKGGIDGAVKDYKKRMKMQNMRDSGEDRVVNAGTSEGVRKSWETRKRGGGVQEPSMGPKATAAWAAHGEAHKKHGQFSKQSTDALDAFRKARDDDDDDEAKSIAASIPKATLLKSFDSAIKENRDRANKETDSEMKEMYSGDADDLESVRYYFKQGDMDSALSAARDMDTAARDNVPLAAWVQMGGKTTSSGLEKLRKMKVKNSIPESVERVLNAGTSEGAVKGWESRNTGHKPGDSIDHKTVEWYVQKYAQKIGDGQSIQTARGWVDGTNKATTAAEKEAIWKAIKSKHKMVKNTEPSSIERIINAPKITPIKPKLDDVYASAKKKLDAGEALTEEEQETLSNAARADFGDESGLDATTGQ